VRWPASQRGDVEWARILLDRWVIRSRAVAQTASFTLRMIVYLNTSLPVATSSIRSGSRFESNAHAQEALNSEVENRATGGRARVQLLRRSRARSGSRWCCRVRRHLTPREPPPSFRRPPPR
jgi:hypothetical protein